MKKYKSVDELLSFIFTVALVVAAIAFVSYVSFSAGEQYGIKIEKIRSQESSNNKS